MEEINKRNQSEEEFLLTYEKQTLHRFRDVLRYLSLEEKLTKR